MKRVLLLVGVVGCAGKPPAVLARESVEHLCHVSNAPPEYQALQLERHFAPQPRSGATYAVIDDEGFVGLVRVTDDPGIDNDDGPQFHRVAKWAQKPMRSPRVGAVAIGPVPQPLPAARVVKRGDWNADPRTPTWSLQVAVDLDGDGIQDLEERTRCGRYDPKEKGSCLELCEGLFVRDGDGWTQRSESCGSGMLGG